METKGFLFEITIHVLISFFCFIWIPMIWVHCHYKYVYSYSAGIDFRRQKLTSTTEYFTKRSCLTRRKVRAVKIDAKRIKNLDVS